MFFDQGKPALTPNQNTVNRSVLKPAPKKKGNFIVYSFKTIWSLLVGFWTRFKKFAWVGSTGNFYSIIQALLFWWFPSCSPTCSKCRTK